MVAPLNTTASDAGLTANEIKTFYKKGLIKYSEKRTVFNQFGQSATIPRNQGTAYEWRRATQLSKVTGAAVALTEGVTPTGSTISFNKVTATPAQYGDFYAGTDKLDVTIYDPLRTIIVDAQAYQMAQVLDNLIQTGVLAGSTNHQFSSVTGTRTARNQITTGDILNETEIRKAVRTLRRNSARPVRDGLFVAVIHPDTTYTLFADPDIRDAMVTAKQQNGGGAAGSLFTGEIGNYMGVTFVESELAPVFANAGAGGTVNVYCSVFFGTDYFGKVDISGLNTDSIFHDVGSAGAADPLNQRWTQGWKTTHASQILNELNAVVVEHAVL
jgi:N4-gp56 family major capsid protein